MRIFTRRGDDGSTGLWGAGGECRAAKNEPRFDAIGQVDALNAALGWVRVVAEDALATWLSQVQADLFAVGAELARVDASPWPEVLAQRVVAYEETCQAAMDTCPPLRHFVLPGGCEVAARLHVARCACRDAERAVVAWDQAPDGAVTLLNRLSDVLFALALQANQQAGVKETPWLPNAD